ncbi:hypothetical protein [Variovorax sp. Sphag1AA]|uniref:hypothetical protein n=1 Tax=Variovorax sp. Sphag1AA TaxID=2587027 RepID=UPI00160F3CB2|nr:hypothetical protein [Variovorax sp. Sphag1AA]
MQRFLSPAAIGAALIALFGSAPTWSAESDISMAPMPSDSEQSSAPAQPQAWTPPPRPASNAAKDVGQGQGSAASAGGAVFMPFSNASASPANVPAPHGATPKASQGTDTADLVLTLVAVLAGVGAVAWLLRKA